MAIETIGDELLPSAFQKINGNFAELEGRIDDAEAAVEAQQDTLDAHEDDLAALTVRVTGIEQDPDIRRFDYDPELSTGVLFAFYGGRYENIDGDTSYVSDGTVVIASGTNYIELDYDDGVVKSNQVGFTSGRLRLWVAVSNGTTITGTPTDYRPQFMQPGGNFATQIADHDERLDALETADGDIEDRLDALETADTVLAATDTALDVRTRAFGYRASTTDLGAGTIGYYGGYLPDGSQVADGTVSLTGTADRYLYLQDGVVTFGATLPDGVGPMLRVPYSAGWQTPVDIRPGGTAVAAAGAGTTLDNQDEMMAFALSVGG